MIAKEINASSVGGLLQYNAKDASQELKRNAIPDSYDISKIEKYMELQTSNAANQVKMKYKHFILSLHPDDNQRVLNDPQLKDDIINDFIQSNGYENQPYVVYEHSDTNALHYHIIASAIDIDTNKKIYAKNGKRLTKRQMADITKNINSKYQLTTLGKEAIQSKPKSVKNQVLFSMQQTKGVIFTNDRQLNALLNLNESNIELKRVTNKYDRKKYGYVFKTSSGKHIKSSDFHHTASYKDINKILEINQRNYKKTIQSPSFKAIRKRIHSDLLEQAKTATDINDLNSKLDNYELIVHTNAKGNISGLDIYDHKTKTFYKSSDIDRTLRKELFSSIELNKAESLLDQFSKKDANEIETSQIDAVFDKFSKSEEGRGEAISNESKESESEAKSESLSIDDILGSSVNEIEDDSDLRRKKKKRRGKKR